jgi:dolichyl-phosphate-mannose-protein mannosyltransferase
LKQVITNTNDKVPNRVGSFDGARGTIIPNVNQLKRWLLWLGLVFVCGIPRVLAAFLLANPDGDAYAYIDNIERWRTSLSAGTFTIKTLFGFWLPAYQFSCAVICLFFDHPVYISKLVSAVCGIGICLLVFQITLKLVASRFVAVLAFLLIALNPLHILFSAFSVTDVPHAFFVLGSLYFVIEKRWILAASFAAVAGLMRVEGWMLVGLLPILQLFVERRLSLRACGILCIAPLLWLYISWDATGNALEYFDTRKRYIAGLLANYSYLANLTLDRIEWDIGRLIYSANIMVMIGGFAGGGLAVKRLIGLKFRRVSEDLFGVLAAFVFFFSFLGFLILAYFTRNQTDIFERYGLIVFALGIPILSWSLVAIAERKPYLARVLTGLVVLVSFADLDSQFGDIPDYIAQARPQQIVANNISGICGSNPGTHVFCDDAAVQALSNVPPERFLGSSDSPRNREAFLTYLKENGVEYIVYTDREASTVTELFPELCNGIGSELFLLSVPATRKDWHGRIWLYRFQGVLPAKNGL